MSQPEWIPTACNLCYANCGVLVQLDDDGRSIIRVKGDKAHPASKGYTCNKALALDYYQNGRDRIMTPLKRNPEGGFDPITYDQAFSEIAEKLKAIEAAHGPARTLYYGGGGQGNHLGGSYAGATMRALGIRYRSNALAQEKTGLGWMNERMLGGMWHGDFDQCDIALIIGKNPWQSNGMQRARIHMRQISKANDRMLVVFDPRRTETADLADVHFAVEPGRDTWLIGAILGHMVQNNLHDADWLAAHADGWEKAVAELAEIPVADYAAFAGVPLDDVIRVAEAMGRTDKIAVYEDLGTEMAPNSTLCTYMNILLFLIPGAFAKEGGTHVTAPLQSIYSYGASSGEVDEDGFEQGYKTSPVTGARILTGLIPCNSLPDEILTDHPDRFRAMICETANPAHSLADSQRMKEAFLSLELMVV
ncbi:MAG: molybdopterin-dependent oxidoreductase, partial [Pseudomonadota bacterium]